jgi:type I restriction enzyme S subunit
LNSSLNRIPIQSKLTDFLTDQKSVPSENYVSGTIDELCNVEYGTRVVRKKDAGTIYPVYGGGGETFFLDTFNRENRVVVARFAMSEKCTRRVSGKFALNDSGLTLSPRDFKAMIQDYLDYLVLSMNDQIYASARGTAQKNLDVPAFRKMEIFFPVSLVRQQEIVETLDRAFAEIDLLRSQFKVQKDFAVALRNSLLSAAFTEAKEVA